MARPATEWALATRRAAARPVSEAPSPSWRLRKRCGPRSTSFRGASSTPVRSKRRGRHGLYAAHAPTRRCIRGATGPADGRAILMRATCWNGRNTVQVENVPDPQILNSRDAIVKISSTSICGSDLHLYDGYVPTMRQGDILGHEFMSEIV